MKKALFAVFLVALLARTLFLNDFPRGFNPDEASFGYDAYSILKTGKDQWGKTLPLVLESFGDYKSPVLAYLAIPFVGILGLTKVAIRLPNAILGSLAVVITYLLLTELLTYGSRINESKERVRNRIIALTAALLLAISPWHIAMSRGAFEANLTTFFLPLGLLFFFKFLNTRTPRFLYLAGLAFGINLFTYHAAKLITVLMIGYLFLVFRNELTKTKKPVFVSGAVIAIFILATIFTFVNGAGTRLADVSIYKLALPQASEERIRAFNNGLPDIVARGFHNKIQVFVRSGISGYLTYFSPQFLFIRGAGETTYGMTDDRGVLYWFELPLILAFVYFAIKKGISKPISVVIFWLMVSPIPAALAIGPGYAANRAVVMLPSIYILCAVGAGDLLEYMSNTFGKKFSAVASKVYLAGVTVFFLSFVENYFFVAPSKIASSMLFGNYEAAKYVSEKYPGKKVVVSRKLSEPHIYVAYANKWNTSDYQSATGNWNYRDLGLGWVDQIPIYTLGNFTFKNIHYQEWVDKDVILLGKPEEFPENTIIDKAFYYPDGKPALFIAAPLTQKYAKNN